MPVFIAALVGALIEAIGTITGKILVSLGFGFVAYQGVDTSITWARDYCIAKFSALPANAYAIGSTLQLGTVISIISSALVARLLINGLSSGTLKRMVVK